MSDALIGRRRLLGSLIAAGGCLASGAIAGETRGRPPSRRYTVVIDPGHGGIDPGTTGVSGVLEKDIVLDTARLVARRLEATRRFRIVLTRTSDEFVALPDRVARARAATGELFLSVHADALPDREMRGASVFTLSERASDKEAAALAARENKVDLIAGIDLSRHAPEVSSILIDLARRQTNNQSIRLARQLVSELEHDLRMLNNSHRSAGFAVLKAPDIPSALVEIGCLSNRQEDVMLRSPAYRQKVATALARSIDDYFDTVAKA
jgi:N-acetylmuramoyl-L-alanine amidase